MLQEWLIFPGRASQGREVGRYPLPAGTKPLALEIEPSLVVRGLYAPARRPAASISQCPTILFFYGNGMCVASSIAFLEDWRACGANIIAADYPGYGLSDGKPGERAICRMVDTLYRWAIDQQGLDPAKLIPAGWSLGGAPAVHIASRYPVGGLILLSAFTSMLAFARREFRFLPVRLMLKHRFENLAQMPQVRCPVLIVHGRRDRLVPFSMAEELRAGAGGPARLVAVDDAGHNDVFATDGKRVFNAIMEFAGKIGGQPV